MFGQRSSCWCYGRGEASRASRRQWTLSTRPKLEHLEDRSLLSAGPDFNGDGFADLAVGDPYALQSRGVLAVAYGSRHGLDTQHSWSTSATQDMEHLPVPEIPDLSTDTNGSTSSD